LSTGSPRYAFAIEDLPQISTVLLEPVVCLVEDRVDPIDDALRELGVTREFLSDPNERLSSGVLMSLLMLGVNRLCDPAFAVHAGLSVRPGRYGLIE
jgi:hypothetical protein